MRIDKFSAKQGEILRFIRSGSGALICDGAVRSGKTIVMTLAFIMWAMEYFDRTNFGVCGKTVTNAERNILKPLQAIEGLPYTMTYKLSNRCLTVRCGRRENYFYLFGGKDESSYMLIQGITLAGVLFDEVALMPQSFVDQAIARTLSYGNAKLWFNCNPESPNHWFYKMWVKDNPHNAEHLHFLMTDNPTLGPDEIKRAESMFSGVFYDRYIRGQWVNAEGAIYRIFADDPGRYMIDKRNLFDDKQRSILQYINIGVDFGGNKSQHAFVATGFDKDLRNAYVLRSVSYPAKDVDVNHIITLLGRFADSIVQDYGYVDYVFADSAEQAIINSLRNNTPYNIRNSIKNEIIDRIRCENILLSSGRIHIIRGENDALIDGLKAALWDDKKLQDVRLDDGTSNIDILDAFEYSFEPYMRNLLRG